MTQTASQSENISDYLATGAVAVITNDGASSPFPAFGPRSTFKLSKSRIEVRALNFTRGSDQMNLNPQNEYYYNHRRGILSFTVISQRQSQTAVAPVSKHSEAIGRTRWLMSRIAQKMLPSLVGGYQIVDIIDQGDTYTKDDIEQTDRTEIRFQVDLLIPPDNYQTP
jgi:hypothetical protein